MDSKARAYGTAIARKPNVHVGGVGCLGLAITLPNGQEAITTATHSFVNLPKRNFIRTAVSTAYLSLWRLFAGPPKRSVTSIVRSTARRPDGAVGQEVWMMASNTKVGNVTATYDPDAPSDLPYSSAFRHDLALVTGDSLPRMTSPPGFPHISGWASYQEVLDGAPVFAAAMNAQTGNIYAYEGTGMHGKAQEAVILGTEYLWQESLLQSAALLWRTVYDSDDARGGSGYVLCQGRPTDVEAKAVIFQNFQGGLRRQAADLGHHPIDTEKKFLPLYKGGFLLPQEIRESKIRVDRGESNLEATSFNVARRMSVEQKRYITV